VAAHLENKTVLITYADSLGSNIPELTHILNTYFKEAVGGVHILPFFPSSGDRGFSPVEYRKVDPQFGTFDDIRKLAKTYFLVFDYMINHISEKSAYYRDFLEKKDASSWKDLFIRYREFWPGGEPTEEQIDKIYKRKPRAPYVLAHFKDGSVEKIWCTFSEQQIDLNVATETTERFNEDNLKFLAQNGAAVIRLDAFAYAVKKPGTSCFFVQPETEQLLKKCVDTVLPFDTAILPEIHEHYSMQLKLSKQGFWVYDFALPMLLLYTLYSKSSKRLKKWLEICPRKQFTTLDTHDGIGVVDVKDLLTDDEIAFTCDSLYQKGANVKRKYSSEEYHNLDIYQINCTYYSALGNNDDAYLTARAVQFFTPGIPMVYYVGMLAGKNDIGLLEATKEGRNINRHYYTQEEIADELKRPVVEKLLKLMKFRNTHPSFNGHMEMDLSVPDTELLIKWVSENSFSELHADFATGKFFITYSQDGNVITDHYESGENQI